VAPKGRVISLHRSDTLFNTNINFPGLGLSFDPSGTAFVLFGFHFYWYGIIIAAGFLLAAWYAITRAKVFGLSGDNVIDAMFVAVPLALICSRLYYVIFNFELFHGNPARIFSFRGGGMAIYGGVIGAVLGAWLYGRFKRVRLSVLLDIAAPALFIGQAIGRWGNFINREAFGTPTDALWRMEVYSVEVGRRVLAHPTFLYESIWCALGFALLHFMAKRRKFRGEIFLMYTAWYGLGRAYIEGLRTDALFFFNTQLRVSQALALISLVLAAIAIFYLRVFKEREEDELEDVYLPIVIYQDEDETDANKEDED
jgi:phosphatidylglycerol:prolipoprotein diacylglycerol transferase